MPDIGVRELEIHTFEIVREVRERSKRFSSPTAVVL